MTMKLADDCFFHDKDRMPHDEALAVLKSRVRPVVDVETIHLHMAQGRYLAESVLAPRDIPAHDNTAVDGYAFSHSGYDRQAGSRLKIVGEAVAGHPYPRTPSSDDAVRIFTGAVMPDGFDTVVMQEDVGIEERSGQTWVMIPPGLKPGANRRLAGEDAKLGAVLVQAGARLRPQDVASAAACGLDRLHCYVPLKVAIFSTGDEIMRAGDPFVPGKVYDANAPMLEGLIQVAGAVPVDLGVLPDRADRVREALAEAARGYDVLVVSGGASQGAEDHVARAIEAIGKRHMWQIAIKPGRPMSFGQVGDCVVLGLPGNPVAVFVCFLIYVRPVLARLAGGTWAEPVRYPIAAAFAQTKKRGRREFWRAQLTLKDGRLAVEKFARDGSGLISSLREADGLIEVTEEVTEVRDGELVDFIPFAEFGLESRT
jgi:molybdopterin molybdotransferase